MILITIFKFLSDIEFYITKFLKRFNYKQYTITNKPTFYIYHNIPLNTKQIIYFNDIPQSKSLFFSVSCGKINKKFDKELQIPGNKFDKEFWYYYFNISHFDKITIYDKNMKEIEILEHNIIIINRDNTYSIS
jgi:hypothetical protein